MTNDEQREHGERHDAEATTVSSASQDRHLEANKRVPGSARETAEKAAAEAAAGEDGVDAVKRVGHELDRTFGGEYEAREDEAAAPPVQDDSRSYHRVTEARDLDRADPFSSSRGAGDRCGVGPARTSIEPSWRRAHTRRKMPLSSPFVSAVWSPNSTPPQLPI